MNKFILIAALAAFSSSVLAEEVHVQIAGKDHALVKAELLEAAYKVCALEARAEPLDAWDEQGCVDRTFDDAMVELKRLRPMTRVALNP